MVTKVHIISDSHFFDEKIIKHLKRPFKCLDDMHQSMIQDWNRKVGKDEIVLHLGDYSCGGNVHELKKITKELNGIKVLVKGNHDDMSNQFYRYIGFDRVVEGELVVGNYVFTHKPDISLLFTHNHNLVNYHGHSHKYQYGRQYVNVNVDIMGYKPKKVNLWDVKRESLI